MLTAEGIRVRFGEAEVLKGVSFTLQAGQWLMVAGPNGAGKTTLVRAVAQGLPYAGRVLLAGEDLARMKPRLRARKLGVLMQRNHVEFDFSAEEVVRLGRYAYGGGLLGPPDAEGERHVEEALRLTGLGPLRHQPVTRLSGGELQRVFLAQLLAQDPAVLVLDEPANHLDLPYQKQMFDLIARWVKQPGRAVLSVVHDLSLARAYGSHALLLGAGETAAYGPVAEALAEDKLAAVYGMDVLGWMREMLGQWKVES